LFENLDNFELDAMLARMRWLNTARPYTQIPPEEDESWNVWLTLSGRGSGKTRLAAEDTWWYAWNNPLSICGVIAPTTELLLRICFEGESGLKNVIPRALIAKDGYTRRPAQIRLINGSLIQGFSADEPERLRGPQYHRLWCDELAAWDIPAGNAESSWNMAVLGLRLGHRARAVITTTPKPLSFLKKLKLRDDVICVQESTFVNIGNLSENFRKQILQYEGTRLGRQEIYGELLDLEDTGIISRSWFEIWPGTMPIPKLDFIVMSLDTAFTKKTMTPSIEDKRQKEPDPTACVVLGIYSSQGHPRRAMLLDSWHEWLEFPDLLDRVRDEAKMEYGPSARKPDVILIEDEGSGKDLRSVMGQSDVRVQTYNPGRADKLARLHSVSPLVANGLVVLPGHKQIRNAPRQWTAPFLDQVCTFRGEGSTRHDDYVDAFSQGLAFLRDKRLLEVFWDGKAPAAAPAKHEIRRAPNPLLGERGERRHY
jgi:predicted phage terminase large subunit-like protein